MSRMLRLMDAGWASLQTKVASGSRDAALACLVRWLRRPDLSPSVATEANILAGKLHLHLENYNQARRYLAMASKLDPTQGRIYYLWGLAYEQDPHGCLRRAARRFRAAVQRDPQNGLYRAAYGRALVRCDQRSRGVWQLRKAATAAPGRMSVVGLVVDGLLEARRFTLARRIVQHARFLNPRNPELIGLERRVRFEWAQCLQRRTTRQRQEAELATEGGRVVLPFIRVSRPESTGKKQTGKVRYDVFSFPQPHFPHLRVRRVDG